MNLLETEECPELHNLQTKQAYHDAHIENTEIAADILADLDEKSEIKAASQFMPVQVRNQMAVDALSEELKKEEATTQFEQMKFANSREMDDLLNNL